MPINKVGIIQKSFQLESIWVEVERGLIPAGLDPSGYNSVREQVGLPPVGPGSNWILVTGFWNDGGEWIDTSVWID
jgi:hypothetical protein